MSVKNRNLYQNSTQFRPKFILMLPIRLHFGLFSKFSIEILKDADDDELYECTPYRRKGMLKGKSNT